MHVCRGAFYRDKGLRGASPPSSRTRPEAPRRHPAPHRPAISAWSQHELVVSGWGARGLQADHKRKKPNRSWLLPFLLCQALWDPARGRWPSPHPHRVTAPPPPPPQPMPAERRFLPKAAHEGRCGRFQTPGDISAGPPTRGPCQVTDHTLSVSCSLGTVQIPPYNHGVGAILMGQMRKLRHRDVGTVAEPGSERSSRAML